jgi:hypothetical protein
VKYLGTVGATRFPGDMNAHTTHGHRAPAAPIRITTDIVVAVTDAEALTAAALKRFDDTARRVEIPAHIRQKIEQSPAEALLFLLDPTHGLDKVPGVVAVSNGGIVAPPVAPG